MDEFCLVKMYPGPIETTVTKIWTFFIAFTNSRSEKKDKGKTKIKQTKGNIIIVFFPILLHNLFHNQEFDEVTTRDECASIQNLQHSKNGIDIEFRY